MTDRITIEVYPDYIDTIIAALEQRAEWHARQNDEDQGDHVIVHWINQIIVDIQDQTEGEDE